MLIRRVLGWFSAKLNALLQWWDCIEPKRPRIDFDLEDDVVPPGTGLDEDDEDGDEDSGAHVFPPVPSAPHKNAFERPRRQLTAVPPLPGSAQDRLERARRAVRSSGR